MTSQLQTLEKPVESNRYASLWLVSLMVVLGLTAMVTAVLVAWPLIAYISSRLLG